MFCFFPSTDLCDVLFFCGLSCSFYWYRTGVQKCFYHVLFRFLEGEVTVFGMRDKKRLIDWTIADAAIPIMFSFLIAFLFFFAFKMGKGGVLKF